MKTSTEVAQQIDQLSREVVSLEASLSTVADRGTLDDLIQAETELTARKNALTRLQARLEIAKQEEAAAAERARWQGNEDAQKEAKTAFDALIADANARRLALIKHVTTEMDTLDPVYRETQRLNSAFQDAWLANNLDKRYDSFSWPKLDAPQLDLSEQEQHAQEALWLLYNSRLGLPGNLRELTNMAAGVAYQASRHSTPQPQLSNPVTPTADAMAYLDDRMSNGND